MKKALFLLLSVIFINASCKNNENKSNKIAGKWKIVEMNINDMSDTEKKKLLTKHCWNLQMTGSLLQQQWITNHRKELLHMMKKKKH